jgi:hypothetical protein
MSTDPKLLTPEQAREQLAADRTLASPRDRRVHAIGTAVLGVSTAGVLAAQNLFSGAAQLVLSAVFVAVCLGDVVWVERVARTVPRRAKLWARLGIGASLVLSLGVVLPWLNLQAQTEPNTWPMVLAGALVAALPSLVAAGAIARRRA